MNHKYRQYLSMAHECQNAANAFKSRTLKNRHRTHISPTNSLRIAFLFFNRNKDNIEIASISSGIRPESNISPFELSTICTIQNQRKQMPAIKQRKKNRYVNQNMKFLSHFYRAIRRGELSYVVTAVPLHCIYQKGISK